MTDSAPEQLLILVDDDTVTGLTLGPITLRAGEALPSEPGFWSDWSSPMTSRMLEVVGTIAGLQAESAESRVAFDDLVALLWEGDHTAADAFLTENLAWRTRGLITRTVDPGHGTRLSLQGFQILFRDLANLQDETGAPYPFFERLRRHEHHKDAPAPLPPAAPSGHGHDVPLEMTFAAWEDIEPIEALPVRDCAPNRFSNPTFADAIMIMAIHDGHLLPREVEPEDDRFHRSLDTLYVEEKDWGAARMAELVAAELGVSVYHRVNVARVLMDFGRFPGRTDPHAGHMNRYAISGPFSSRLTRVQQRAVFSRLYDGISEHVEGEIAGQQRRVVLLNFHTYDPHNPDPPYTQRQHLSLLHTPMGYVREKRMPFDIFDPAYPDRLGESTADPKLVSRIALTIGGLAPEDYRQDLGDEWDGKRFRVGFNHPYELPDGSLEVRAQVWSFFEFVKRAFDDEVRDREREDEVERAAFALVWRMVMDTNLRDVESAALRSYLHMFREGTRASLTFRDGGEVLSTTYEAAERAYERVVNFIRESNVVERFEQDPRRLSAMAIEVRKDLLWTNHMGRPIASQDAFRERTGRFLAKHIARAVATYIEHDALSNEGWL